MMDTEAAETDEDQVSAGVRFTGLSLPHPPRTSRGTSALEYGGRDRPRAGVRRVKSQDVVWSLPHTLGGDYIGQLAV